jgi:hypothetical protein
MFDYSPHINLGTAMAEQYRMTKAEVLDCIHSLLFRGGGDQISQDTLGELQGFVAAQLEIEEKHGACKLTKLNNGFIREIELPESVYSNSRCNDVVERQEWYDEEYSG